MVKQNMRTKLRKSYVASYKFIPAFAGGNHNNQLIKLIKQQLILLIRGSNLCCKKVILQWHPGSFYVTL